MTNSSLILKHMIKFTLIQWNTTEFILLWLTSTR